MREKFIEYSEIITKSNSIENQILEIKNACKNLELYHEEGACLEKLLHLTHDYKLFKDIGDIFLYKVRNSNIANAAYNKYLYYCDREFYNNFSSNLKSMGCNFVSTNNQDENLPQLILSICDKYDLIVYMMICLHKNSDYDGILELNKYLKIVRNKVILISNSYKNNNYFMDDIEATNKHLSQILSQTKSNIRINQLAIELDKTNQQAYINIIEYKLEKGEKEAAIQFYNSTYINQFNNSLGCNNIESLAWIISDYYRDKCLFYDSIKMQKYALETELDKLNA